MVIETDRLILRKVSLDDFDALFEMYSDPETMRHYPKPYSEERMREWILWNIQNYHDHGFGIWVLILKQNGKLIGDCGITIQNIRGQMLPEIGYHIHKDYWRQGYGSEAARAVRDWGFNHTDADVLYSYMKYSNVGSYSTAISNGMKLIKEYPDPINEKVLVYGITRQEWQDLVGSR